MLFLFHRRKKFDDINFFLQFFIQIFILFAFLLLPSVHCIEMGLEQAPFFSSFEHVKSLLIIGPNNTKNIKSVIFSYLTMNNIVWIFFIIVQNTKFDQETVSLLCVKTKSGGP